MVRRRYQRGNLRQRGRRNPVWELQWREDYLAADGAVRRRLTSAILGSAKEISFRQARRLADEHLLPLNQGKRLPEATMTLKEFVERHFKPNLFPTLKPSTQGLYASLFNLHLFPAFGGHRLCDIGPIELQRYLLQKMASGLGGSGRRTFVTSCPRCSRPQGNGSSLRARAQPWA